MNTIREMAVQGKPVRAIAHELGVARNTVRRYVRGGPCRRQPRHAAGVEAGGLQRADPALGARGSSAATVRRCCPGCRRRATRGAFAILKDFVRPLRPPAAAARRPVIRYETKPGEQLQFDWGEFLYEQGGQTHKLFGFTAVLELFADALRDLRQAHRCAHAHPLPGGGLRGLWGLTPSGADRSHEDGACWTWRRASPTGTRASRSWWGARDQPARVQESTRPQTKGKVERSVGVVKHDFWPGVRFTEVEDLNQQAAVWCAQVNARVHRTTHRRPNGPLGRGRVACRCPRAGPGSASPPRNARSPGTGMSPSMACSMACPADFVPGRAPCAGERPPRQRCSVWHQGQVVLTVAARSQSGRVVPHPDQFRTVPPAAAARRESVPLGHQIPAPPVDPAAPGRL